MSLTYNFTPPLIRAPLLYLPLIKLPSAASPKSSNPPPSSSPTDRHSPLPRGSRGKGEDGVGVNIPGGGGPWAWTKGVDGGANSVAQVLAEHGLESSEEM